MTNRAGPRESRQAIVIESVNPPADVITRRRSIMIRHNPHGGRSGVFPLPADRHADHGGIGNDPTVAGLSQAYV
jgi:hypothetical protein